MAEKAPDYYALLGVPQTATPQQIRDAYKRAALKTHPDRVPSDSPERASRTKKFQLINDAYYTLSDATRRRNYDAARRTYGFNPFSSSTGAGATGGTAPGAFTDDDDIPNMGAGANAGGQGQSWWQSFGFGTANREQAESAQFADVFEEMLREEGLADDAAQGTGKFWSMIGGLSGAAMGFIIANVPGLVAGAVAGNRLGAVRDTKGKSVYAVFQELPQQDKARLLSQLAAKVFAHAVGSGSGPL